MLLGPLVLLTLLQCVIFSHSVKGNQISKEEEKEFLLERRLRFH